MPNANIFVFDSAPLLDEAALSFYLPQIEKKRQEGILRAKNKKEKAQRLATGLLIKHFLGERQIKNGPWGKPFVEGGPDFSLSHSGNLTAFALGDCPLGLDVQKIVLCREKVAARFFQKEEIDYLANGTDKDIAFCRLWTLKEAQCKATGLGIAHGFSSCQIRCTKKKALAIAQGIRLPFYFYEYSLSSYYLALCSSEKLLKKPLLSIMTLRDLR